WVVRAAAAEVRLGDEHTEPAAELLQECFQLAAVGSQVDRRIALADVAALLAREADEADARVAVMVGLAAGHGPGESLLAVKAVARGDDHLARGIPGEGGPERLLNRLRARRRPEDLFQALAARLAAQELDQPLARLDLDAGDRVVSGQRQGGKECTGVGLAGATLRLPVAGGPAHVLREAVHPGRRVVSQVGDEDSGGEV